MPNTLPPPTLSLPEPIIEENIDLESHVQGEELSLIRHEQSGDGQPPFNEDWSWKRDESMREGCPVVNGYCKLYVIGDIRNVLENIGLKWLKKFEDGCFGHLMALRPDLYTCKSLLHCLVSREINRPHADTSEKWFRIGERFIRFSRIEFALIMGLRFGDSTFDLTAIPPFGAGSLLVRQFGDRSRVIVNNVYDLFRKRDWKDDPEDAVKLAKIITLHYILLGVDSRKFSIEPWVWALVDQEAQWESFPWGKYAYKNLLRYIDQVRVDFPSSMRRPSYHFYGCTFALLILCYETVSGLDGLIAKKLTAPRLQIPRCLRWEIISSTTTYQIFSAQPQCLEVLIPTEGERNQIWWRHIEDDLDLGVQVVFRTSRFQKSNMVNSSRRAYIARKSWSTSGIQIMSHAHLQKRHRVSNVSTDDLHPRDEATDGDREHAETPRIADAPIQARSTSSMPNSRDMPQSGPLSRDDDLLFDRIKSLMYETITSHTRDIISSIPNIVRQEIAAYFSNVRSTGQGVDDDQVQMDPHSGVVEPVRNDDDQVRTDPSDVHRINGIQSEICQAGRHRGRAGREIKRRGAK